jgi:hypothetical protein
VNVTATPRARRYRCPYEHLLELHGDGRHRRYDQLDELAWRHPVDDEGLSLLRRPLPGERRP